MSFRKLPMDKPYECFNNRSTCLSLFYLCQTLTDMELFYVSISPEYIIAPSLSRSLDETIANFLF